MNRTRTSLPALLIAIHRIDVSLFLWVMQRKHLALGSRICRTVSRTADGYAYPLAALAGWQWGGEIGRAYALALALTFLLERPLYFILKRGLKRNRPAATLPDFRSFIVPADQFSFPSGHTSGAFAMTTLLLLFFPALALPAFLWAALVGASRVTLGVHFPTDILAGMVMGISTAGLCAAWLS